MRIGILGGTFNPVHNGHLHIAKEALKKLHLDKVIFVPTYIPPHKKIEGRSSANDRLKMLRLAIKGKKKFMLSTYEIEKGGKSYSIKIVKHFKKKYGKETALFFLIGADSLKGLKDWKSISVLRRLVQFAVFPRPDFSTKFTSFPGVLKIDVPKNNISSTKIRCMIREERSVKRFVPRSVLRYIEEKELYKS